MKLLFLAGAGPASYEVSGAVIDGIDFSVFTEGSKFVGNEETRAAHIYGAEWVNGELLVTLAQPTDNYQMPVYSHDWTEGEPIDAAEYDPQGRYVQATNPQAIELLESGQAEYWRDPESGAWTVRMIETAEELVE